MMTYGDGVADVDLDALLRVPRAGRAGWRRSRRCSPRAASARSTWRTTVRRVRSFVEKPQGDGAWMNGGLLRPRAGRARLSTATTPRSSASRSSGSRPTVSSAPTGTRLLAADGHLARQAHPRGSVGLGARAVEDLVMFGGVYAGRRVFVTGHTGFKGSWLTLLAAELGAEVTGYALDPPTEPSLFEAARPRGDWSHHVAPTCATVGALLRGVASAASAGDGLPPRRAAAGARTLSGAAR